MEWGCLTWKGDGIDFDPYAVLNQQSFQHFHCCQILMVERFFHVISGFRAPFPVPLERKAERLSRWRVHPMNFAHMMEPPQ